MIRIKWNQELVSIFNRPWVDRFTRLKFGAVDICNIIWVWGAYANNMLQLLIYFTVFGCSNPTAPDDSVLDRNGDHAIIICDSNNGRWEITCRDGEWHGDIGICSESKNLHINNTSPYTFDYSAIVVVYFEKILVTHFNGNLINTAVFCIFKEPIPYKIPQENKK